MKRMLIATGLALTVAVSLAAQTPATPADRDQAPGKAAQSAAAEKSVTLKGCLRAGDQPDTFVLADAAPATAATGTTGAATGAAAAAKQTVRLIGSPSGMNLKDHVGHTVEVTGMVVPQGAKSSTPAGTTGTPAPGAATGAAPGAASADTQQRLNIKTIKHVDAKCGAQ